MRVLQDHGEINHVIIITGDVDFRELLLQLKDWDVRVTLICQEKNYSPDLVDEAHHAYAVSYIAEFPTNWWTTLPQSELETIRMIQYNTDGDQIQQILAHLDPSKPYHTSAGLTALIGLLDHSMRNPTVAEALKAEITPALERFKEALSQNPQTDLLTQLTKVYEKIDRNEIAAILQLAEEKQPGAFEKLCPLLDHPDLNHRQTAIVALGRLGDHRAREPLEAIKKTILERLMKRHGNFLDTDDYSTIEYIDKALDKIRSQS